MFDLDKALASWRKAYAENDSLDQDSLTELEDHLRDEIDSLRSQGLSSEEAYEEAYKQLGQQAPLNAEYAKVHPDVSWKRRLLAMIVGYMSVSVLLSAAGIVSSLFERLLWHLGLGKVVYSLPWSVHVGGGPFGVMGDGVSREVVRWNEVSLAALLTAGIRAAIFGMIVYFFYRCLHRRVIWLDRLLTKCRSRPDHLVVSLVALGVLFSQTVFGHYWYRMFSVSTDDPQFEMWWNGTALISPLTIWIQPLALCLVGWFALGAYRKQQLSGRYDVVSTAICGFMIACLLVRMTSFLNRLIMVNLELAESGIDYGGTIAPAIYILSLSVVVSVCVIAMLGRGFPTLRRFLNSLPRRPCLVMAAWIFMHVALMPVTLAVSVVGIGHELPLLENEVVHPVLAFLTVHWVPFEPFMHFAISGQIFSAVLTAVVVLLALRANSSSTASSQPATLA